MNLLGENNKIGEIFPILGSWILLGLCGLLGIIVFILQGYLFNKRIGHTAIKLRRPTFINIHLINGLIFSWIVIPFICLLPSWMYLWYSVRVLCIFLWSWTCIVRYWVLYFDHQFAIVMKIGTPSNASKIKNTIKTNQLMLKENNALRSVSSDTDDDPIPKKRRLSTKRHWRKDYQKNFKGPKLFVLLIGLYCFFSFSSIVFLFYFCTSCSLLTIEIIFLAECLIPITFLILGTYAVWNIYENWKIRDELVYTFFSCLVLLIGDAVLTALPLNNDWIFFIKMLVDWSVLLITALWSTLWVLHVIPFDKATKVPSMEELAVLSTQANNAGINGGKGQEHVPLGYILCNQVGYAAFVQHCVDEINVENLFFIEQVCYFKFTFLFRTEKQYVQKSNRFDKSQLDLADRISLAAEESDNKKNSKSKVRLNPQSVIKIEEEREESMESNRADYEGGEARRFTQMAWGEVTSEAEEDIGSDLVWSPNNSLAVLTFRMNRGDTTRAPSQNVSTKKSDITTVEDYHSARNLHHANMDEELENENMESGKNSKGKKRVRNTLYDIARSVYHRFIVEGSEMEINISSKNRSNLHFFFHQQNLPVPVPKGSSNLSLGNGSKKNLNNVEMIHSGITDEMQNGIDQSSEHLYKLYHIFDGAWAEIWHLISSNVYPRFITTDHYLSIKQRLFQELDKEKHDLYRITTSEDNSWFDHIKPRKLEIIGVKALPVDEQVVLFGKPVVRVKNAKV